MRETRTKTYETTVEEVVGAWCDCCGKDMLIPDADVTFYRGGIAKLLFGFGSSYDQISRREEQDDTYEICDECVPAVRAFLTQGRKAGVGETLTGNQEETEE